MKAFSWFSDKRKSRKGETGEENTLPVGWKMSGWNPVEEIPALPEDDYERTRPIFEVPEWDPDLPVMEVPPQIPPEPVADNERFQIVGELPDWDLEEPAGDVPPVQGDDYEPTRPIFEVPEWEPDVPVMEEPPQFCPDPVTDTPRPEPVEEIPQWVPQESVIEVPAHIPSAVMEDYAPTCAVFDVPEWDPDVPVMEEPPQAAAEIPETPLESDITVLSRTPKSSAPVQQSDDEKTRAVVEAVEEVPPQKHAVQEAMWEMTGRDTVRPPREPESERKPDPPRAEPVKPVAPVSVKPIEREQPKPVSTTRKSNPIPVKPKPATPTEVNMKTPEVPDFGRSISAEVCDFSVRQQWNWLGKLNEVIPTLRLGTEPACVDYPLTLRNMKAVGDMRITVKRVAMGVGTMLSITNLENAITCEDTSKLREAAQILNVYGTMVSGRQADAIRMTVRYLGVRVAELQMR